MGPLSWVLLGLVAGWLAGAFVGGAIANVAGYDGRITDFSVRSVLIAALGAAVLLVLFGAVSRGR